MKKDLPSQPSHNLSFLTQPISNKVVEATFQYTLLKKQKLVRENVKSLSNSVTKFCDQEICEKFQFFRH